MPRAPPSPDDTALEDYCPVYGLPDEYCVICGIQHESTRPPARVAGREFRFTRDGLAAIEREASAWEGSREYDKNVHGVCAHARQLRALAQKIATLLTYTG